MVLTAPKQAEGRDATDSKLATSSHAHLSANWRQQNRSTPTEICVPQAIDGTLRYTVMEIIPTEQSGPGTYWVLRQKAMAPQALPYTGITTSDTPRAVMAPVGIPLQMAY